MKIMTKRIFYFLLSAIIFGFGEVSYASAATAAPIEGQERWGGDPIVSLFYGAAEEIMRCLPNIGIKEGLALAGPYSRVYQSMKVSSEDKVFDSTGVEVDAVNISDRDVPQVILGRQRWLVIREHRDMVYLLTLHEMLHLLGLDDHNYGYSNFWYKKMSKCLMQPSSNIGVEPEVPAP